MTISPTQYPLGNALARAVLFKVGAGDIIASLPCCDRDYAHEQAEYSVSAVVEKDA